MSEPIIACPKCKFEIKLTESLAAPLLEATRQEYERRVAESDAAVAKREKQVQERESALKKDRESLDQQLTELVQKERPKIIAEEARKAKLALGAELEQQKQALADIEAIVKEKDDKLAEAQKTQAEFLKMKRKLEDERRAFELKVEQGVQDGLEAVKEQAKKEAEQKLGIKVTEKDQLIGSLQKQIEELQRKAEQGSQQLQGEAQEIELRALLSTSFPTDTIEPVPKGEFGGDVLQRVNGPLGQPCGTILWESKRTKNWSDAWLQKLRDDQRAAHAEIAVILTQALPKGVDCFTQIEGVWVTNSRCAIPLAIAMRGRLIEVSLARASSEGQQTKMELIYDYLTGPHFRLRVQAIVEAYSSLREDLENERRAITRLWAKREKQLTRAMEATVGMYGDLQGIAGKSLQEIEGMEMDVAEPDDSMQIETSLPLE